MTNETVAVVEKVSGSKHIANFLKEKGIDTPANEVVAALKEKNIEVTVPLVNNVKFRLRAVKAEKKKARKGRKKVAVPVATAAVSPVQNEFDRLVEVKKFAATVGGLDALSELIGKVRTLAS